MRKDHAEEWYSVADQLEDLLNCVTQLIAEIPRRDRQVNGKLALACLTNKAHVDFRATLILCRQGFVDSAEIVARTVMYLCLTIIYISENPRKRGRNFWAFELRQRVELVNKLEAIQSLNAELSSKVAEWEAIADTYKPNNKKRIEWPDEGQMIDDLNSENQPYYRLINKVLSYKTHALPLYLLNTYVDHRADPVIVKQGFQPSNPGDVLSWICPLLHAALQCVRNAFDLDINADLVKIDKTIGEI